MKANRIVRIALVIACVTSGMLVFQRYTSYGIFAAGGGKYWVKRAVASEDENESKACLKRVLGATQYGVNVAERAVGELTDRDARARLWRHLVEIAPNDNWRAIYARRIEAEHARGAEPTQ